MDVGRQSHAAAVGADQRLTLVPRSVCLVDQVSVHHLQLRVTLLMICLKDSSET